VLHICINIYNIYTYNYKNKSFHYSNISLNTIKVQNNCIILSDKIILSDEIITIKLIYVYKIHILYLKCLLTIISMMNNFVNCKSQHNANIYHICCLSYNFL